MKSHKADKKCVNRWEKKCKPEMTQQFMNLMDEVEKFSGSPVKRNSKSSMSPVKGKTTAKSLMSEKATKKRFGFF